MQRLIVIVLLLCSLLLTSAATAHLPEEAKEWVLPADQWTPKAHLWLSRAMTSEVGWNRNAKMEKEQVLLAYILVTRFNIRKTYNRRETFVNTIRSYCNGMKKGRKKHTKRMRWVLGLSTPPTHMEKGHVVVDYPIKKPRNWPKKAWWQSHQKYYGRTWEAMDKWAHGHYKHPCPGAKFWGAREDPKRGKQVRLPCSSNFRNIIYGVK